MTTNCWSWKLGLAGFLVIGGAIASSGKSALAQITPDTTLGNENSTVTSTGEVDSINGGATRGANLFHSFGEFNVDEGRAAVFTNPSGIENILTRVTGANPSNILGTLGVAGNANLFFMNPNGIIFGQNARLDIGGSFVGTTANAIGFGEQDFFSATDKNIPSPLLTINPSALLFNQINQNAAIQNNSVAPAAIEPFALGLRVPNGKSLLLVGGNVNMDRGELNANGGRVELGGLNEPGTVLLGVDGDNLSLKFPENVVRASVSLINNSGIYVIGAGGGNIAINASNLEISEGTILLGGIEQDLGNPETVAGDITLNATEKIKVTGIGSIVANLVRLGSQGNGGSILIDSDSFSLSDGAQIAASTFGQGNAGNVTVRAKDSVSLADNSIFSTVEAGGIGKGGDININAATLSLIDGAQLQTSIRRGSTTQLAGRGEAGNINVNVTGAVDIAGGKNGVFSAIRSESQTGTVGNAGNITIDSGSFSLGDGAGLTVSTSGQGNAGNVIVRAKDAISLEDAQIFSTVEAGGIGKGGNIAINAATLSLIDGAQLASATLKASATQPAGRGNAGNVNINVTESVVISGEKDGDPSAIGSLVQTGTVGNGGNITIDSGSLSLGDGAQLNASTGGQGNAGNVTVRVKDAVTLTDARIFSTVEAGGIGKGGNIGINAAKLSLINGAQLATITRRASTTQPAGRGNAGNVNINVTNAVDIARGKNGVFSVIASFVEMGAVGNGGNITIDSGLFSLGDGAQIAASTFGQGNAGNVTVRAKDSVSLADSSIFSTVEAGGIGKGGDININAAKLSLIDGAQLQTSIRRGSTTQLAGRGEAGNINVNVTGAVDIAGEKNGVSSGFGSFVETGTVGNAGNILIDSGSFSLRDGALLEASTGGQGNAGIIKVDADDFINISGSSSNVNSGLFVFSEISTGTTGDIIITSPRVTLDNGGTLNAQSELGNGGNINLNVRDFLLLRRGAQISTTAGTAQAGGDGGNINIDAPYGFIVAGARENNDITANAFNGNGGRVTINAAGIFGIAPLSRQELEKLRPDDLDASQLPTNDITAISQTNPTLSGTIELNLPNIELNSGLVNLPTVPVDTQVAQACTPGSSQANSEFVVTGRGGLPPTPNEALNPDAIAVDWVTLQPGSENKGNTASSPSPATLESKPIVEAQGWIINKNGQVVLTASAPTATPHSSWQTLANCHS